MASIKDNEIHCGMNLLDAIRVARQRGCEVRPKRRTGEIVFSHPGIPQRAVVNGRRKDSPRHLIRFIRHAAQQ